MLRRQQEGGRNPHLRLPPPPAPPTNYNFVEVVHRIWEMQLKIKEQKLVAAQMNAREEQMKQAAAALNSEHPTFALLYCTPFFHHLLPILTNIFLPLSWLDCAAAMRILVRSFDNIQLLIDISLLPSLSFSIYVSLLRYFFIQFSHLLCSSHYLMREPWQKISIIWKKIKL